MRILVLGGYGNFGARISRALARDAGYEVIAAGRDPEHGAERATLVARVARARLDLAAPGFARELARLGPGLVVHCAGPFQGQDYRVARAAIAAGAHYVDLADGRAFVTRFAEHLGGAARAAGVLALSGASSVPALSSAVVDALAERFSAVRSIEVAIAPGQRAPRGAAAIAAVLGYAGRPFDWWRNGAWTTVHGWQGLRRLHFAGLGSRWAAACDIPDLELFPVHYPGVLTVEFRAALELPAQQLALWLAAALRRAGVPLPLERWAAPLDRLAGWMDRLGTERGGMLVRLEGIRKSGARGRVEWHLMAGANHGPEVPCMAAILLARKLARGAIAARGAYPCLGFLALDEFTPELQRWGITTMIGEYAS
ncbi:MAG: saccharopine dehydrogenase NADP-binding domain-containing protein [Burkholderiales bacterium]|nr:saccharopine dehydrogenase NADP-binding domain-containing protein [Burkholderiales bacterium]